MDEQQTQERYDRLVAYHQDVKERFRKPFDSSGRTHAGRAQRDFAANANALHNQGLAQKLRKEVEGFLKDNSSFIEEDSEKIERVSEMLADIRFHRG